MFSGRRILVRLSRRSTLLQRRTLCDNNKSITTSNNDGKVSCNSAKEADNSVALSRQDAYKQLENLDFMTAAKILFTDSPKKKKFRLDFHLVQFFFACLPSLAVYLVAQYARYEIRRMEAEAELKKKSDEEAEAEAKELELMAEEEKQQGTDPQLFEVKARLDKLEETLQEIVVESKKQSADVADRPSDAAKKEPAATKPGTVDSQEKATPPGERKTQAKTALPDQKQIKNIFDEVKRKRDRKKEEFNQGVC